MLVLAYLQELASGIFRRREVAEFPQFLRVLRKTSAESRVEHLFERLLKKYGRQNPEIQGNYFLEDTVEEGNVVSHERLQACARPAGTVVPLDRLFVGIDWTRRSDFTRVTVVNHRNDVIGWLKVPHVTYPEQVDLIRDSGSGSRRVGLQGLNTWSEG